MPIVPVQTQAREIGTDVPGPTTFRLPEAGGLGAAIQGAGSQVASEGMAIIHQIKEAEAVTASSTAHAQDQIDSQAAYSDFSSRSKDGNAYDENGSPVLKEDGTQMSLTEQYRNWANDRFQKNQLNMPSELAQQKYQELGRNFFTQQMLKASSEEDTLSHDAAVNADSEMLQRFGDNLTGTPDVNQAYQYANTFAASVMQKTRAGIYSASDAPKIISQGYQKISELLMKGAHNQVLAGTRDGVSVMDRAAQVDYWRRVLNEDDGAGNGPDPHSAQRVKNGLPTISGMLNPDTKAQLDAGLIQLKKTATELDKSEFHNTVTNAVAALQMGKSDRVNPSAIFAKLNQMQAAGKIQPNEAADVKAQLVAAGGVAALQTPAFALAPSADQKRMIEAQANRIYETAQAAGGDKQAGSMIESKFRDMASKVIQDSESAKQKDFPDFIQSVDPSVKAAVSQLDFSNPQSFQDKGPIVQQVLQKTQSYYNQTYPGQPQYARVVSRDQADQLSTALKNPSLNSEQTANAVDALRKSFGPQYPTLINQMVQDSNLPASWKIAGFLSSSGSSGQDVAAALKGGPDIEKNFDSVASANMVNKAGFKKSVNEQLAPWVSTMLSQNPGDPNTEQQVSETQATVMRAAMKLYAEDNGKMGATGTAKQAVQSILGNNASIEEAKPGFFSGGRNYTYMIPNQTATTRLGDPERAQIRQFISNSSTGEALKNFGVVGPPGSGPTFLDDVAKTGRFALAPNMQGYNYFYVDPKSQRDVPARVPNGKGGVMPLFIPIEKMIQPTGQPAKPKKVFGQVGGQ